ncbi:MAG: phospholipase D-like domain-containing protein [Ignavibacteria bacterium]|nr:phospholipase D-like domain-containing protein [Ignavibacteria bacterium]
MKQKKNDLMLAISKNFSSIFFLLILLLSPLIYGQASNHVVISEVAPMGGASSSFTGGEFIELYNPLSTDILFGANIKIASGSTTATANAAEWQISLAGKTIRAYGYLLIAESDAVVAPDITFPASKNLANSGIRSGVALLDGTTIIDAFAWDASTTIPAEGTKFTPSSTTSDKKSFARKSGPDATANDNLGNAWDSNNNASDFFGCTSVTANPQNASNPIEVNPYGVVAANGVGSARLNSTPWQFNTPTQLVFVLAAAGDTVKGFKLTKPTAFSWNIGSMTVMPNTISLTESGDTLVFDNFILRGTDSIVVTIQNVTSVDTTDEFSFNVRSAKDSITFSPLQAQPKTLVYGTPRSMSTVKTKNGSGLLDYTGKWVVVKGIVTVANEFGGPSYLQDETAAIGVYDSSVSNNVLRGDEIVLLGKVSPYYEMFELNPCSVLQKVSEGNSFDTLSVTIAQVKGQVQKGVEPYECRLIKLTGITKVVTTTGSGVTTWTTTGSGTNYKLISGLDSLEIRVTTKSNLANTSVPSGTFDVVGALGQFNTFYQILPRSIDDIIVVGAGPHIISGIPYESNIKSDRLTFTWQTDTPGTSIVNYGTTTAYGSTITDTNKTLQHAVTVTELNHASLYHIQIGTANNAGTTYTQDYLISTASQSSSGVINVYFNQNVNTTLISGEQAQVVNISQKLISRINAATFSIDLALYSLSGTVGANIANALIAAKGRGVKVRVIGEKDNQTTAPWSTLKNNGITVIDDGYDALNAGAGLMHNKFTVIDNRDATSDIDDWVLMGSWNATDPGNDNDAQNVVEIQDKALANAYTTEFNEMWGSDTDTPNAATCRFGARKLNNTPHSFNVNGTRMELYFSPSDGTNSQIVKTLNRANESINFAMLSFTQNDIGKALITKYSSGIKVRGVIDNRTDTGEEYDTLLASGVDVHLKANLNGLLHHKYAIIDINGADSTKYIITGSHNWSSSAETKNNENTLIIRSPRLANLYVQEFAKRYTDAGGTDPIIITDIENDNNIPTEYALAQNYPNPFNPSTTIQYSLKESGKVDLDVYNMLGQKVLTLVNEFQNTGNHQVKFDASRLASGVYIYRIKANNFSASKKLLLLK